MAWHTIAILAPMSHEIRCKNCALITARSRIQAKNSTVQFLLLIAPLSRKTDLVLTNIFQCQYTRMMSNAARRKPAPRREERVSRTYRLRLSKLRAAKRALGAATATEAIELALDLAVFQRELIDGTRAMLGIEITSPDPVR